MVVLFSGKKHDRGTRPKTKKNMLYFLEGDFLRDKQTVFFPVS